MPIFLLSILLQVALVVHIVKTGRNTTWIWIVVMLPLAGSIAYVIVELLPGATNSRRGRAASRALSNTVNPNKDLKRAINDFSVAGTVENSSRLADELMQKGMFDDAKALYQESLKGIHKHDPVLMHGLARAEFELGNPQQSKVLLDDLIQQNPDFKDPDAHLLYARVQDALGNVEQAIHEYEVLNDYYPGAEATYRYALLCQHSQPELANNLLVNLVKKSETSGAHYKSLNKEWIRRAKQELRS